MEQTKNVLSIIKKNIPELEKLAEYLIEQDICFYANISKLESYGCELYVVDDVDGTVPVFSRDDSSIRISAFGHFDRSMYDVKVINHPDLGKFMISIRTEDGCMDEIMCVDTIDLVIKFFDNMIKLKEESDKINEETKKNTKDM